MQHLSTIKPFETEFKMYHLPAVRIIGKEIRNGGSIGNTAPQLWGEMYGSGAMEQLKALPSVIEGCTFGWTCEYDAASDTFVYIVCVMTPAGTPVPEGMVYRDIPETDCAVGLYGESVPETVARANAAGYTTNWEPYGWNAELYLQAEEEDPPKQGCTPWRWLVPVKSV